MSANITYSAKIHSYETYNEDIDEIYGGTYTQSNPLQIDVRIWNNRYGTYAVDDLTNFCINIEFEHYEDSVLLDYIKIYRNGTEEMSTYVSGQTLVATFMSDEDVIISGAVNDGLDTNTDNYLDLYIILDVDDSISLKNMDLKSMLIEAIEQ